MFLRLFLLTLSIAHADPIKPRVLIVVAHPDDEYFFAGSTYRITHDLKGTVDQVVITDGQGGYKYSLLAEPLTQKELTNPLVAAKKLPAVRRKELAESGKILGIRDHYFLNKLDQKTLDLDETYRLWGGKENVKAELKEIIQKGNYDYLFTLLPTETNHGHHKAAGILSLEVVAEMKASERPIILASVARTDGETAAAAKQDDPEDARTYLRYRENTLTQIFPDTNEFTFDRLNHFGFKEMLNYQIVVNWMIGAHKSQGAFQLYYNKHRFEDFKVFRINSEKSVQQAKELFKRLNAPTDTAIFKPEF